MNSFNTFLVAASMSAAMLLPNMAQAMSVRQYESESKDQQVTDEAKALLKIVDDVAKVNPAVSQAIHDYFLVIPPGQPEAPGFIQFEYELMAVKNLAAQGKADLDKVQMEGILLYVIKKNVMPKFAKEAPPSPPAPLRKN